MFGRLVESIRLEARSKAQQYHGMMMQNPEPGQAEKWKHHYRSDAKKLADKVKSQGKGEKGPWIKKLRSYDDKHSPSAGQHVRDLRKDNRSTGSDKLAKKAAMSPRERRSANRASARGINSESIIFGRNIASLRLEARGGR